MNIKGIFYPKTKICWSCAHQAVEDRWVCFFIKLGEMYHSITVSAMDALQWMGTVRMRVQTADKNNLQVIHTTPVHQLTSWEDKSCMFVRNKYIVKIFLSLDLCFRIKYEFIIHNNAYTSEKVNLLLSSFIKTHPHICLELFWTVLSCKQCLICADFSPDSDQMTLPLEEALL